jgi:hypothetical protein
VTKLIEGAVNSEVTLEVAPGVEIVSIITKASAASLGLAKRRIAADSRAFRINPVLVRNSEYAATYNQHHRTKPSRDVRGLVES